MPRERLAEIHRLAIVEPRPVDVFVQLGSGTTPSPYVPPTKGASPSANAAAGAIGGAMMAGIGALRESRSAALTARFREHCPDYAARTAEARRELASETKLLLAPRFNTSVMSRAEYESTASTGSTYDAYLLLDVQSYIWADGEANDYRPTVRGNMTLMDSAGAKPIAVRELLVRDFDGPSFPHGDDVVEGCSRAIAALDPLADKTAQRVAAFMLDNPRENQ